MTEGRKELFSELRAKKAELLRWHYHRCYISCTRDGLTNENIARAMRISALLTKTNYEMDWAQPLEDGKVGVEQVSESLTFLAETHDRYFSLMNRYRLDAVLSEYADWLGEQLCAKFRGNWIIKDNDLLVQLEIRRTYNPSEIVRLHFEKGAKDANNHISEFWRKLQKDYDAAMYFDADCLLMDDPTNDKQ